MDLITYLFYYLEKEMATHSSVLAWRIPGTAEPGGLPSVGLHIVGHDWSDLEQQQQQQQFYYYWDHFVISISITKSLDFLTKTDSTL